MPAPIVGLRDVKGAAMNAESMVNGWPSASMAPRADNTPLIRNQYVSIVSVNSTDL